MVCTCFYDENDNFNDKRFILTSYNHVVSKEDKKSSSSKLQSNSVEVRETTLKKSLDHTTPDDSVLQHGLICSGIKPLLFPSTLFIKKRVGEAALHSLKILLIH